jgi:hypothetical protein
MKARFVSYSLLRRNTSTRPRAPAAWERIGQQEPGLPSFALAGPRSRRPGRAGSGRSTSPETPGNTSGPRDSIGTTRESPTERWQRLSTVARRPPAEYRAGIDRLLRRAFPPLLVSLCRERRRNPRAPQGRAGRQPREINWRAGPTAGRGPNIPAAANRAAPHENGFRHARRRSIRGQNARRCRN